MRRILRFLRRWRIWLIARFSWRPASTDGLRLGPFESPRPRVLSTPAADEPFDPYDALHGSLSSPRQCAAIDHALWVEVQGKGDCIRYYPSGLADGSNPTVLVFLGGDVMLRTPKGVRFISPRYAAQTPAGLLSEAAAWSAQAGRPGLHLARPGILGSSGDHNMRRREREIDLMNGALEQVKRRHDITHFILVGQSGGGQIVAALLSRRRDISAAVICSGLLSVKRAVRYWKKRNAIPGKHLYDVKAFYDPVEDIDGIRKDPPPAIYVLSDPEDVAVPFFTQLHYVRRLRAGGFKPHHIYAHGSGRRHHMLAQHGRLAAAMIARGESETDIVQALAALDLKETR